MRDDLSFLEIFGEIDDEMIYQAARPWRQKTGLCRRIKAAAIVLITILCISGMFHSEVKAGLERMISYISQVFGIKDDISSYTDVLGKTVSREGLSITLEEAILEQSELVLSYRIEAKNETYKNALFNQQVWINGKKITSGEGHLSEEVMDSLTFHSIECCRFDETYEVDGVVEVKIILTPTLEDGSKVGIYEYEFSASCEKIKKDTIEIPLEKTIQIENYTLKLQEFTLNGLETTIKGASDCMGPDNWDFYIKGRDSLGNFVRYRMNHYYLPEFEFVLDKTEGYLSPRAEWVELQFYIHEAQYETLDEVEHEDVIEGFEYDITDPEEMHPVGEKFKIQIRNP